MVVRLHLDLVSRRQERVESNDQLRMTPEQVGHSLDDAGRVDTLRFELFHDIEEIIVHLGLIAKAELHLVEIAERVLHLQPLQLGLPLGRGRWRALCRTTASSWQDAWRHAGRYNLLSSSCGYTAAAYYGTVTVCRARVRRDGRGINHGAFVGWAAHLIRRVHHVDLLLLWIRCLLGFYQIASKRGVISCK